MKQLLRCCLLVGCMSWVLGCQDASDAATHGIDSNATTMDSLSNNVRGSKVPAGQWISALASDAVMTVTLQGKQLHVHWSATVDSDFEIDGAVFEKGAGVYGGKLTLASGDAAAHLVDATLRFDPHGQTLTLDLPVMWEDTVMFRRAPEAPKGCTAAGETVVEKTELYRQYSNKVDGLGLMDETEDVDATVQDYQIYESIDGENRTLERLRVDFGQKLVSQYNVVEDNYEPIAGSGSLFEGVSCK